MPLHVKSHHCSPMQTLHGGLTYIWRDETCFRLTAWRREQRLCDVEGAHLLQYTERGSRSKTLFCKNWKQLSSQWGRKKPGAAFTSVNRQTACLYLCPDRVVLFCSAAQIWAVILMSTSSLLIKKCNRHEEMWFFKVHSPRYAHFFIRCAKLDPLRLFRC